MVSVPCLLPQTLNHQNKCQTTHNALNTAECVDRGKPLYEVNFHAAAASGGFFNEITAVNCKLSGTIPANNPFNSTADDLELLVHILQYKNALFLKQYQYGTQSYPRQPAYWHDPRLGDKRFEADIPVRRLLTSLSRVEPAPSSFHRPFIGSDLSGNLLTGTLSESLGSLEKLQIL